MNHMTSGASNDIERATDVAGRMVCEWGMSPLGPMKFRNPSSQEADAAHHLSEATAERVDAEIERIVMEGYQQARTLLEAHREAVRDLAEELLQNESLDANAIGALLARRNIVRAASDGAAQPLGVRS